MSTTKKIEVNGTYLNYVDYDEVKSTPLVLIHAFPLDHTMWKPQLETLSRVARVIAYDVRGFGASKMGLQEATAGKPTMDRPSMELFAKDLLGLLHELAIPKAVLVGLSMGGYIALRAKELAPGKVSALVLADTKVEADSEEAKEKRLKSIATISAGDVESFVNGFLSGAISPKSFEEHSQLKEQIRRIILANPKEGIIGALRALMSRTDTSKALSVNPVPTLILVGEDDSITPVSSAEKMKSLNPHATLDVVPKAGHLSNMENPGYFNAQVLAFLGRT